MGSYTSITIVPDVVPAKCATVSKTYETYSHRNHFYGINAMKILIKSDRSISALLKYLEQKGKGCILLWYLDARELEQTKSVYIKQKIQEIRYRYDVSKHSEPPTSWQTEVWRSVNENLPDNSNLTIIDLRSLIPNIEIFCLSLLSYELYEYLDSPEFSKMYEFKSYVKESISVAIELDDELKSKYKHVLIIDDSLTNSQLMTYAMEAHGHRVRQANHGRIGINLAALNHLDVILIDLSMTTMNPLEVIKRIKMNQETISLVKTHNQSISPVIIGWVKDNRQYSLSDYGIDCINAPTMTSSDAVCNRSLELMLREFYHVMSLKYEEELYSEQYKRNDTRLIIDSDVYIDDSTIF